MRLVFPLPRGGSNSDSRALQAMLGSNTLPSEPTKNLILYMLHSLTSRFHQSLKVTSW